MLSDLAEPHSSYEQSGDADSYRIAVLTELSVLSTPASRTRLISAEGRANKLNFGHSNTVWV